MAECCVCYDDLCSGRCTTMKCGHKMHTKCIKTWYLKNEDPTCPMCRGPFRFKGFLGTLDKWEAERDDFEDQIIEDHFERLFENIEDEPWAMKFWFDVLKEDQVLYNILKSFSWEPEWIEEYLYNDIHPWISPKVCTRKLKPVRDPIKSKPVKRFFSKNGVSKRRT
jgi:hypothetical protein